MTNQISLDEGSSKDLILVFIVVFIVFGIAAYFGISYTSENLRKECEEQCDAKGEDYAVNTAGTVGSSIEGGRNRTESSHQCMCISRQNK